jgi:Domain of unknown function (DUF5667)
MVELLPSRRRAEEFARALEGDAPSDPRVQRLLATVSALAAVPVVEPRPEFRDTLRRRLVETAAVDLPAQASATADTAGAAVRSADARHVAVTDTPHAARVRRRLVAAATGLVLVGAGGGVAAASEQALPGDVLYPVKRTLESAQVTLAQGTDDEGRALLERASTRLQEAEDLGADAAYSATEVEAVEAALRDFAADASGGGRKLLDSYAATGDATDLRTLRDFTARSHQVLGDLGGALPAEVRPVLVAADETVVALDGLAVRACEDCTSGQPPLSLPTRPVAQPRLPTPPAPPDAQQPRTPGTRDAGADAAPADGSGLPGHTRQRPAADDTASPVLPDLDLRRQEGRHTTEPSAGPSSDAPDGDAGQAREPLVRLHDVLGGESPETRQAPRSTDVGDLTDPLSPLLNGDLLDDML